MLPPCFSATLRLLRLTCPDIEWVKELSFATKVRGDRILSCPLALSYKFHRDGGQGKDATVRDVEETCALNLF